MSPSAAIFTTSLVTVTLSAGAFIGIGMQSSALFTTINTALAAPECLRYESQPASRVPNYCKHIGQ